MTQKKSNNKTLIIILAVLLAGIIGYTLYNTSKYNKLTEEIKSEKLEIEQNLDSMIVKYEDAILKETALSNELAFERDRIIALRDSIKSLKNINYSIIRKYRKRIAELEKTNQKLFAVNDSLMLENKSLTVNLDSVTTKYKRQIAISDTLQLQNEELYKKVAKGSELDASEIKAVAMRKRNSGKFASTSRANRTDAFRINFTISKNRIASKGNKDVYIQVANTAGKTIASKGKVTLKNELDVEYSDKTQIDYKNENIDVVSLIEIKKGEVLKGEHYIRVFIDGSFAGSTKIKLR